MLVKNWMSKDVITIDVNNSMEDASKQIKEHDIRGLPVMKNGKLVGVVTNGDIKRASASDATTLEIHELIFLLSKIKIKDIMTKDPVVIPVDNTVEEAAEVLLENKLSGAPVVDDKGGVVGVITQHDLFRVLISLTGVKKRGIQFAFQLEDKSGSIKDVTDIIRKFGCQVVSIMSTSNEETKYRHVYIRVCDCDREKLGQLKEELKANARMLYLVDHSEGKKEVYEKYERPSASWVTG